MHHPSLSSEQIARVCHEVNRVYCAAHGDTSQVPWDAAPEWVKSSAIRGVNTMLDAPETTAEQLHNAWMADKFVDGWVYGSVKDADQKTHPCLLPYNRLPPEQRVKDHLFATIVRTLASIDAVPVGA